MTFDKTDRLFYSQLPDFMVDYFNKISSITMGNGQIMELAVYNAPTQFAPGTQAPIPKGQEAISLSEGDLVEVQNALVGHHDGYIELEPTGGQNDWTELLTLISDVETTALYAINFMHGNTERVYISAPNGGGITPAVGKKELIGAGESKALTNGDFVEITRQGAEPINLVYSVAVMGHSLQVVPNSLIGAIATVGPVRRAELAREVRETARQKSVAISRLEGETKNSHPLTETLLSNWDGVFETRYAQEIKPLVTTFDTVGPHTIGRSTECTAVVSLSGGDNGAGMLEVSRINLRAITSPDTIGLTLPTSKADDGSQNEAIASEIFPASEGNQGTSLPISSRFYREARPGDIVQMGAVSMMVFRDSGSGLCQLCAIPFQHFDAIVKSDMTATQRVDYLSRMSEQRSRSALVTAPTAGKEVVAVQVPVEHSPIYKLALVRTERITPQSLGVEQSKRWVTVSIPFGREIQYGAKDLLPINKADGNGVLETRTFLNSRDGAVHDIVYRGMNLMFRSDETGITVRRHRDTVPNQNLISISRYGEKNPTPIMPPVGTDKPTEEKAEVGSVIQLPDGTSYIVAASRGSIALVLVPQEIQGFVGKLNPTERASLADHLQNTYISPNTTTAIYGLRHW